VRNAVPDACSGIPDDVRSAVPDARSALHDARGAPHGVCAAELAARPPRRRGIAAMEAEGWPPEPDVESDVESEWNFLSSSDSDVELGPPDGSNADMNVWLGAATPDARLGAADETLRLGVPADADTDDGDGPGGVALGVVFPADTDTDHDGGGVGGGALCFGPDSDLENPGGEGCKGPRGTQPGAAEPGAGAWLRGPLRPGRGVLPPVAQMLVLRVLVTLQSLQRPCLQALAHALSLVRHTTQPLALRAASALLGLAPSRIWRMYRSVQGNGWSLVPGASDAPEAAARNAAAADITAEAVMLTLVRTALAVGAANGATTDFVKAIARLSVEGVPVGQKYHTRHFYKDVQYLGARCLQARDREDLFKPLGGLGIGSSCAVLFDGVPVGSCAAYGRHGNVLVVCVSSVSPHTHRLRSQLLTWAIPSRGHGGPETAAAILTALAKHPLGLELKALRAKLCAVGGDGLVVRGGPDRKKPGTQACEFLWQRVHPQVVPVRPGAANACNITSISDDAMLGALVAQEEERDAWVGDAEHLHYPTEWDKFHREDMALTRAIRGSPMATEVFDVCLLCDQLFGLGDGPELLRAAGRATQTPLRGGALPGMTRKAAGLSREPGHLLDNFKAYAAGIHVRREWTREGHAGNTLFSLAEAGRRLTALDFVAFVLLFRDIMERVVSPWTAVIQSASLEPWALAPKHKAMVARRRETISLIHWARELLRICTLLRQHAPIKDPGGAAGKGGGATEWWDRRRARGHANVRGALLGLGGVSFQLGSAGQDIQNLIKAAFYASPRNFFLVSSASGDTGQCTTAWGRQLPSFLGALCSLIGEEKSHYKGVQLITQPPPHPAGDHMLLGPHCQCSFLAGVEQSGSPQYVRDVPIGGPARSRPGGAAKAAHVRITLPAWVVNSPQGAVTPHGGSCEVLGPVGHALAAVIPAPLRFHWRSRRAPKAVGVDQTGKFRDRIRPGPEEGPSRCRWCSPIGAAARVGARVSRCTISRCSLPESVPLVFADLDNALQAAGAFLNALAAEEDAVFGPEGTNAGMARALRAMCTCFDWGRLVGDGLVPTTNDLAEFKFLAGMLMPYLQHTEWPSEEDFPEVRHAWPCKLDKLQMQYMLLMNRLRKAASMPRFRRLWWSVTGYYVEPLQTWTSVLRLVRCIYGSNAHALEARQEWLCRIAAVVSSMLGGGIANQVASTRPDARPAPSAFFISTRLLARCGVPWRNRRRPHQLRRSVKEAWAFQPGPGNVGVLMLPGRVGRLVHVTRTVREMDWSAVSASVDGDPFFSAGNVRESPVAVHNARKALPRPDSAWHAVRIHHQCRPMGSPEACCERAGSLMQHRWAKRRHPDPGMLMDGVLLQDAQVACIGGERDEALCRDVAQILTDSGCRPFVVTKHSKRRRKQEGIATSRSMRFLVDDMQHSLEMSGRLPHGWPGADDSESSESSGNFDNSGEGGVQLGGSKRVRPCGHRVGASTRKRPAPADSLGIHKSSDIGDLRQAARAEAQPAMQLPARVAQVLQDSVVNGHVTGFHRFHVDARTDKKSRARSAVRSAEAAWLQSDDGRHYQAGRKALATGNARPGGARPGGDGLPGGARPGGDGLPGGQAAKSASSKGRRGGQAAKSASSKGRRGGQAAKSASSKGPRGGRAAKSASSKG
jgi:hypothetical protein